MRLADREQGAHDALEAMATAMETTAAALEKDRGHSAVIDTLTDDARLLRAVAKRILDGGVTVDMIMVESARWERTKADTAPLEPES